MVAADAVGGGAERRSAAGPDRGEAPTLAVIAAATMTVRMRTVVAAARGQRVRIRRDTEMLAACMTSPRS